MAVRLGELLLNDHRITSTQLQEALDHQQVAGGRVGLSLVSLGSVTDAEITELLSRHYAVPSIDLPQFEIDAAIINLIPAETAHKYQLVPLSRTGTTLTIAITDPGNVFAIDDIKFMTGCQVEAVVAAEAAVLSALARYYPGSATPRSHPPASIELVTKTVDETVTPDEREPLAAPDQVDAIALGREGTDAPIVRLVNLMLVSAIQKGASDIHIEPYEQDVRIRFRIDGLLVHVMSPPMKFRDAITSRVKIMANLNIAEKRLPQDGRIKVRFAADGAGREIDFRVSCLPTLFGEKLVLRLLDKGTLTLDMTTLGFERESLSRLEAAIARPWGMVLVTGPTGSGKTSTLYSALSTINTADTNIMTAEDPVEFNLPGVNQVQVRDQIGLSFAAVLRSFLRQDPNVILVGEIRDVETAAMAVKAALTGHLVLSTLHTNDAPGTINRLMNMGIEPFLVASSVNLICAQRLVRRICASCAADHPHPVQALVEAGFTAAEAARVMPRKGVGCHRCRMSGYSGRVGLYEVMAMSDGLRELMLSGASAADLKRTAVAEGMITLRRSGLRKVIDGVTTLDEVIRETAADRAGADPAPRREMNEW